MKENLKSVRDQIVAMFVQSVSRENLGALKVSLEGVKKPLYLEYLPELAEAHLDLEAENVLPVREEKSLILVNIAMRFCEFGDLSQAIQILNIVPDFRRLWFRFSEGVFVKHFVKWAEYDLDQSKV